MLLVVTGSWAHASAQGGLSGLTQIQSGVKSKRISSYDRTGGNNDRLENIRTGERRVLCDIEGAGVIQHIWITIAPPPPGLNRNDIILRMYWDGSEQPSVETPIGPFFGQGWDEAYTYNSLPIVAGPIEGRALVSYFKMPFAKGARIEIENQNLKPIDAFYYYVDYLELKAPQAGSGYFHAWYNHQLTETRPDGENEWDLLRPGGMSSPNRLGEDNYVILDVEGKGHFVGVNYYVNNPSPVWYGEGDDMIFIDGDPMPTLHGTGTEDYFNTSWCPKEPFSHPYYGYPRVNGNIGWLGRTHVYRYHIEDPIFFERSLRFTIEHGHNNYLPLDLASVAYWYAESPMQLPPIQSRAERTPQPEIDFDDIHRWRDAWRREKGGGPGLWGNETHVLENPIHEWLILGPFENPQGVAGFDEVWAPEEEGVDLTAEYRGKGNQPIRWQAYSVARNGLMNFDQIYAAEDFAVAFGSTWVYAPTQTRTQLKVGSDDGVKVWLNDRVVLSRNLRRGAIPDSDIVEVVLEEGWNHVLVKNVEEGGDWGFFLQFDDPQQKLKYSATREP